LVAQLWRLLPWLLRLPARCRDRLGQLSAPSSARGARGGRAGSAWTEDEVAQVVELGRTQLLTQLHRGNFSGC
jgi:hypothetical protein